MLQVLWDDDETWYDATVLEYRDGLHKVRYHDDGLEEWLNFDVEQVVVGTRVVWAKVKGHPWWPAKVWWGFQWVCGEGWGCGGGGVGGGGWGWGLLRVGAHLGWQLVGGEGGGGGGWHPHAPCCLLR